MIRNIFSSPQAKSLVGSAISENNQAQISELWSKVEDWWENVGIFTKSVFYASIAFYVLTCLFSLHDTFSNIPSRTLGQFEIHRIFMSPFANEIFIQMLIGSLLYMYETSPCEQECGTILISIDMMYLNVQIQVLFLLLSYILSGLFPSLLLRHSFGILPVFLAYSTKRQLSAQRPLVLPLWQEFKVNANALPIANLIIVSILTLSFPLDLLAGTVIGYILNYVHWTRLTITQETIVKIEKHPYMSYLTTLPGFVCLGKHEAAKKFPAGRDDAGDLETPKEKQTEETRADDVYLSESREAKPPEESEGKKSHPGILITLNTRANPSETDKVPSGYEKVSIAEVEPQPESEVLLEENKAENEES